MLSIPIGIIAPFLFFAIIVSRPLTENVGVSGRFIEFTLTLDLYTISWRYEDIRDIIICVESSLFLDCRPVEHTVFTYAFEWTSDNDHCIVHAYAYFKGAADFLIDDKYFQWSIATANTLGSQLLAARDFLHPLSTTTDRRQTTVLMIIAKNIQGGNELLVNRARDLVLSLNPSDLRVVICISEHKSRGSAESVLCAQLPLLAQCCSCNSPIEAAAENADLDTSDGLLHVLNAHNFIAPARVCIPPAADVVVLVSLTQSTASSPSSSPEEHGRSTEAAVLRVVLECGRHRLAVLSDAPADATVSHARLTALKRYLGDGPSMSDVLFLPPSSDSPFASVILLDQFERFLRSDRSSRSQDYLTMSTYDSATASFPVLSTRPKFLFDYGMNTVYLSNAYLINRTTVSLVAAATAEEPLISIKLASILEKSYSGFMSQNLEHSGWHFVEHRVSSSSLFAQAGDYSTLPKFVFPGVSAALSPPFTSNVFHAAQVLMALVNEAEMYAEAVDTAGMPRSARKEDSLGDEDTTLQWVSQIERILLPTVRRSDLVWTLGLARVVATFVRWRCAPVLQTSSYLDSTIDIYLFEDVEAIFRSMRRNATNTCTDADCPWKSNDFSFAESILFEHLLIMGAIELRVPFVSSHAVASRFRAFTYAFLGLEEAGVSSTAPVAVPNDPLNITLILRSKNRWIYNIDAVIEMLHVTGLLGPYSYIRRRGNDTKPWPRSRYSPNLRITHLESLSFREQVALMRETDVLLSPHGAGLQNLMFLRAHSAVIELMTSPWYEPGYQATALLFDLHYSVLPQTSLEHSFDCVFHKSCLSMPIVRRRDLNCFGMRLCNAIVDVEALETAVWQASQAVRILKRRLHSHRHKTNRGKDAEAYYRFYEKGYEPGRSLGWNHWGN